MGWNRTLKQDLAGETELTRIAAIRYLGRREYSAAELRQRLSERGAAAADIEAALVYVKERGYQDDARAGEVLIRRRTQYSQCGQALMRQELIKLGYSAELCSSLLEEHYPLEMERDILQRLLAKTNKPADAQKLQNLRKRMLRRLVAKGFQYSFIIEALQEWLPSFDDEYYID
ncbi:MAG: RecX family transcriptional regulator [Firmicutes bacterium]|nr:RecX family transcriptional regulator [Bacillota bacterium]